MYVCVCMGVCCIHTLLRSCVRVCVACKHSLRSCVRVCVACKHSLRSCVCVCVCMCSFEMLCLPPIPVDYDYKQKVVCKMCCVQRSVIAAGRSFFERFEQKKFEVADESSCLDTDSAPELSRTESKQPRNKKKEQFSGNALRLSNLVKEVNLYQILCVGESCGSDEIKKSYRKLVLEKHPDKLASDVSPRTAEKGRAEFLQIQEAFEVLSDERNRRLYDSSLPFDDTLPTEKIESDDQFFSQFGPAFTRNERWCITRPIPSLGTPACCREKVESFYDFWFNKFESWRDFSHHDEHDLKHADSRDERRWMEVQNARIRKKRLAEETSRIRRLVDLSYKADPRIRAFKQADLDEIAAIKQKKLDEKLARENEKNASKINAEKARIALELEAQLEAERKKEEKSIIKKMRAEIRQILGINTNKNLCPVKVEKFNECLMNYLSNTERATALLARARECLEQVESFMEEVDRLAKSGDLPTLAKHANASTHVEVPATHVEAPVSRAVPLVSPKIAPHASPKVTPHASPKVASIVGPCWTADELQLLTRGMQKYPVGTVKRWETIQALIGSRSVSEIVDMSKQVAMGKVIEPQLLVTSKTKGASTAPPPDVDYEKQAKEANEWTAEEQAKLEEAMRTHPSTIQAGERWTLIAQDVGRTKQECVARFKYIRELLSKKM